MIRNHCCNRWKLQHRHNRHSLELERRNRMMVQVLVHSKLVLVQVHSRFGLALVRSKLVQVFHSLKRDRNHDPCHALCRIGQLVHLQRKPRTSSKQLDSQLKIDSSEPP